MKNATTLLANLVSARHKHETGEDAIKALLNNISRIERRLAKRDRPVLRDLLDRSYHDLDYLVSCVPPRLGHAPTLPPIGLYKPVRPAPLPRRFDARSGTWRKIGKRRFAVE